MALDKQKILSELNNVVNQLQRTDCGCMGKLFSTNDNKNVAMNYSMPAYGGCGHSEPHAHRQCCGASYQPNQPYAAMNRNVVNKPCVGQCNPPQLYADTYNYLNGNLMQPVVQEVYEDLKSITPANTISNNPIARNMNLSQYVNNENRLVQPNMGSNSNNTTPADYSGAAPYSYVNTYRNTEQSMRPVTGMGPQIVNMMMSDNNVKPNNGNSGQNGQVQEALTFGVAPSGFQPVNYNNANQTQHDTIHGLNLGQETTNAQQRVYRGNAVNPLENMHPFSRSTSVNSNATGPQQFHYESCNPEAQKNNADNRHVHGQHTQGVAKFNEMFPGVMQSGDLGFDPMAIAIQMNPANQQKAAIETMQKVMNGKPLSKTVNLTQDANTLQSITGGVNTAIGSVAQSRPDQGILNSPTLGQTAIREETLPYEQTIKYIPLNYTTYNTTQPQQVYTSVNSYKNEGQPQPSSPPIQYEETLRQTIEPNTGAITAPPIQPTVYEGTLKPITSQLAGKQLDREAIYPVDNANKLSKLNVKQEKFYEYNTLGQPVEMLPAKMYHMPEPNLPQTLAPQPASMRKDHMKYSNVKSTVSKTSLIHKSPVGRSSSRSQLQQVYNQYKGSQSYTQQNVQRPAYGTTQSEGHLKLMPGKSMNQAPVDRVGDTSVQNLNIKYDIPDKGGETMGRDGNIPITKPDEDIAQTVNVLSKKQLNCRNGLQDIAYTSYPTTTAWSFH